MATKKAPAKAAPAKKTAPKKAPAKATKGKGIGPPVKIEDDAPTCSLHQHGGGEAFRFWNLALEHNQIAVEPSTAATSKPGIFAIGDVVTYPGKLKLILTGFSEAAIAARSAYALVHPETPLHFEYSTTAGVPDA